MCSTVTDVGAADIGAPSPGTVQLECGGPRSSPWGSLALVHMARPWRVRGRVGMAEGSTLAAGLAWVCISSGNLLYSWLDRYSRAERWRTQEMQRQ